MVVEMDAEFQRAILARHDAMLSAIHAMRDEALRSLQASGYFFLVMQGKERIVALRPLCTNFSFM
jgi:hypothetical protein